MLLVAFRKKPVRDTYSAFAQFVLLRITHHIVPLLLSVMQFIFLLCQVIVCVLCFASVYYALTQIEQRHFEFNTMNRAGDRNFEIVDVVYFSLITQSTVGFGSIVPVSNLAKVVVSMQVFSTLAFVVYWSSL